MKKILFLLLFFSCIVSANEILYSKIENIIGKKNYLINENLIKLLFKDEYKFIGQNKIKYIPLFQELKRNGLLDLRYNRPQDTIIEFTVKHKRKKGYKILQDTLRALGYRYFLTENFTNGTNNSLYWKIKLRSEYMIDPLVLSKELQLKHCKITNVENQASNHWCYELDFSESILNEAYKIEKNEKVKFQKPLQEYLIAVDDIRSLQIISRKLNDWYPYIVFFDKDLNILKTIKKERIYKGYTTKVPKKTKYIKITDLYNLINIKRGLSIIVK
jgi:hypothetical protein